MKFSDTRESKYLKQSVLPKPCRVTIDRFTLETVGQGNEAQERVIMYFVGKNKGMVVNVSNQAILEELFRSEDTDHMVGKQIVIWADPSVQYAGKRTGGLRIMDPRQINQHFGATPMTPATGGQPVPTLSADPVAAVQAKPEFHVPDDSATAGAAQEPDGFLDGDTPYAEDDIPF